MSESTKTFREEVALAMFVPMMMDAKKEGSMQKLGAADYFKCSAKLCAEGADALIEALEATKNL